MAEMNITSGGTYSIASGYTGTIIINTTDAITIDGTNAGDLSNVNIIVNSETADIKIKNLNVTNSSGSIIKFGTDKDNKLTLVGTNTLKTDDKYVSAINNGGGLTIDGEGSLNVTARYGAAIGSEGYGYISGENNNNLNPCGNITINGGTINAKAYSGAAIGSGDGNYESKYNSSLNSVGDIIINGGNITATSSDGAGIGTGSYGGYVNDIIINGGTINATGTYNGTGIGGSNHRGAGSITINGGEITATSYYGAGIGGSLEKDINIKNGKIIAKSGWGAGIGSEGSSDGSIDSSGGIIKGNIIISGGTVTAASGAGADIVANYNDGGAGIGGGRNGSVNGDIIINGTANVTANAGRNAAAIGSGYSSNRGVHYSNGTYTSTYLSTVGNIKISGDATVTAISEFNCVGIGAGLTKDGGGGTKGSIDIGDTTFDGHDVDINYNAGAITIEGDTSTSAKSNVTIINGDIDKNIVINGKKYSGESKIIFSDGQRVADDFNSNITAGGRYVLPKNFMGTVTINTTEAVTIDGTSAGELKGVNILVNSATADLTIKNLNITNKVSNVIKFGSGTDNKLTLIGTNKLITSAKYEAGIHVGGGLTIDGEGLLDVQAQGTYGGAGIGNDRVEESLSDIKINGGTITASGIGGAGIGSGQYSSIGNIVIGGSADVTASSKYGAGIGSGWGSPKSSNSGVSGLVKNIKINGNAKINATSYSGAGIGSSNDGEAGDIEITDSAVVTATSTNGGAGIGSGESYAGGSIGNITINGLANVTATATKYGAGIGSGYAKYDDGSNDYYSNNGKKNMGNISIGGDATVTATSLENGIGIGAGYADEGATNTVGTITLSNNSSTSTVSTVTINNSDTAREITINGKNYSGSQIVLKDGLDVDDVLSGDYKKADTFTYNGGNVIITNYSGEDTVKIKSGKVDSYSFAGDDLVFKIGNDSLTLKNMKNHAITVKDSTNKTTTKIYGTDYSPQDVIKKMMSFLQETTMNGFDSKTGKADDTKIFDAAVRVCSRFKDAQDLIDHFVADCRTANDADKFLREYCGIILDNTDTGAITGWDAGGLKIKTAEDIMPETLPAATLSSYSGETFTKRNLSIYLPERAKGYEELDDDKKRVLNGAYSWWVEESLKLIEESYGITFEEGEKINLYLVDKASDWPYPTPLDDWVALGGKGAVVVNMSHVNVDDNFYPDGHGLDRTFAHELTHVVDQSKLGVGGVPSGFFTEGLAELTQGSDDRQTSDIKRLAGDADLLENQMSRKQPYILNYAAGYMLWRYLAKQASDIDAPVFGNITANVKLNTTSESYYISGEKNSETASSSGKLKVGSLKNKNYVAENLVAQSIVGSNEGWSITATDIDDVIITGSGNDSINTRSGSDTVNSGAGNDVIDYFTGKYMSISGGEGNDTIYSENRILYGSRTCSYNTLDGGTGNDSIEVDSYYTTVLGGEGNDSIKYGNDFNYWDGGNGDDYIYFWGKTSTVHGGAGNDTIENVYHGSADGSDEDANIIFYGDDGDDVIKLVQKNNHKNITVNGGKGNDTLSGSNKGEVFQYAAGDGFDLIQGFDSNDTLNITNGTISKTLISGSDLILSVSNGNITLKDVKNSTLTLKLADGTLTTLKAVGESSGGGGSSNGNKWTINGTTAKYSNSSNTLCTITGLKSGTKASNISVSGNVVTLKAASLGTSKVSITGGYTLALATDVKKSKTTPAKFIVKGTTATYKSANISAGYTLASNKKSVTYTQASGGNNLFTVKGLKKNTDASNLTLKNKVVTLKAAALNENKVTISKGYSLALAGNVKKSKITAAGWSVSGTTAYYKTKKITAGYSLSSDKTSITYSKADGGNALVTLSGLKSNSSAKKFSLSGKNVTINSSIIGNKGMSVKGDGYTFMLNGKGKLTNIGGAATLKGSSKNDTLVGGKGADILIGNSGSDSLNGGSGKDSLFGGVGADILIGGKGNDTLTGGKGKDVFVHAKGDGKDIITDYTAGQDKIKITSGSISKYTVKGKDVVFTVGKGSITVKNGKGKKITVVDSNGKISTKTYTKNSSTNIAELWFTTDDTNFSTSSAQIDSITQNELSDYSLGNVDAITDLTDFTPTDSLTSGLTFSDK